MKDKLEALLEMAFAFNREIVDFPFPERPTRLRPDRKEFALTVFREEDQEFNDATSLEDEVDAVIDGIYFRLGRLLEMGVLPGPSFEEVHKANMAKTRGTLNKRSNSKGYDAVKPEGWQPPNLEPLLSVSLADVEYMEKLKDAGKWPAPGQTVRAAQAAMQEEPPLRHGNERPLISVDYSEIERRLMAFYGKTQSSNILVLGYARHGKDTVGELLQANYGLHFTSSSEFCAKHVVFPEVRRLWDRWEKMIGAGAGVDKPKVPDYSSPEECFTDRANHRAFWYETIWAYNNPDPTALGRAIFNENDVYCGLRHPAEFHALVNAGVPDLVVWVDRSEHLPPEDSSSCGVQPWMADFVIDNNGDLEALERNVRSLFDRLFQEE